MLFRSKAALALVERLAEILGSDLPTLPLSELVEQYEEQIDEMISQDESLTRYLERIENLEDDDEYEYDDEDDE